MKRKIQSIPQLGSEVSYMLYTHIKEVIFFIFLRDIQFQSVQYVIFRFYSKPIQLWHTSIWIFLFFFEIWYTHSVWCVWGKYHASISVPKCGRYRYDIHFEVNVLIGCNFKTQIDILFVVRRYYTILFILKEMKEKFEQLFIESKYNM